MKSSHLADSFNLEGGEEVAGGHFRDTTGFGFDSSSLGTTFYQNKNYIDFSRIEETLNGIREIDPSLKQLLLSLFRSLIIIINSILGEYFSGSQFVGSIQQGKNERKLLDAFSEYKTLLALEQGAPIETEIYILSHLFKQTQPFPFGGAKSCPFLTQHLV